MPGDLEFDDLIDAALSGYSATEAQPGLERRILENALAQCPRLRRLTWAWAFVGPAAVCLMVFLLFSARRNSHRSTFEATVTTTPAIPVESYREPPQTYSFPSPSKRSIPHKSSTQRPTAGERLPKEEVFPSPTPLTAEERAAVALVRVPPRMPRQADTAGVAIDPIHIAELQIKPIVPPDESSGTQATESSPEAQQP